MIHFHIILPVALRTTIKFFHFVLDFIENVCKLWAVVIRSLHYGCRKRVKTKEKRSRVDLKSRVYIRNERNFNCSSYIAHFRQQRHNSKCVIFQERLLKVLKCYNCLWVQWRHNCSPAASFANCIMTLYLLKVHLQTFLSTPITPKSQNFELQHSCHKWAICNRMWLCFPMSLVIVP
jgi:hypothetical protein